MGFEAQARRLCDAYWNLPPGTCKPETFVDENQKTKEIDAVVRSRDVTHLVLITTSTKKEKISADIKRLIFARKVEQKSNPLAPITMWLITERQIDGSLVTMCRAQDVNAITITDFKRRFFDGSLYCTRRADYPFGSAEEPSNSGYIAPQLYVNLPMTYEAYNTRIKSLKGQSDCRLNDIYQWVADGLLVVILAPFGSGKSFTCKELFNIFSKKYQIGEGARCPIAVNLRDHWSQDSDEILERHGKLIGYPRREELNIGIRANMCSLIIDGFDEIGITGVANIQNKNFMREVRTQSMVGLKGIVLSLPSGTGAVVAGRDHYFDDVKELASALGLVGRDFRLVRLGEFNEANALELLKSYGIDEAPPDWIPRKPLFLSYLAKNGLLKDAIGINGARGQGNAWDEFIDYVCLREAKIAKIAIDPESVRNVLIELSGDVRSTYSGTGPITTQGLAEIYKRVTDQEPTNQSIAHLQRLPCLTLRGSGDSDREFVDQDMLWALQGFNVAQHALRGTTPPKSRGWLSGLNSIGIGAATHYFEKNNFDIYSVVTYANSYSDNSQFSADLLMVAIDMAQEESEIDCRGLKISGAIINSMSLENVKLKNSEFHDCQFGDFVVGEFGLDSSISIKGGRIVKILGVSSRDGLPEKLISQDCEIESFDELDTNAAIVRATSLSNGKKALLTVLRKLYIQAGSGRKLSALKRGIPPSIIGKIDGVLDILEQHNMVSFYGGVVQPVRKQSDRAKKILASSGLLHDDVVELCDSD